MTKEGIELLGLIADKINGSKELPVEEREHIIKQLSFIAGDERIPWVDHSESLRYGRWLLNRDYLMDVIHDVDSTVASRSECLEEYMNNAAHQQKRQTLH